MATQSKEAPGQLDVVRAFVNTRDIDHGLEELAGPHELVAWLAAHQLLSRAAQARPGDLRRAVLFREALRDLLLSNNDGRPVPRTGRRSTTWPLAPACACALDDGGPRGSRPRATASTAPSAASS